MLQVDTNQIPADMEELRRIVCLQDQELKLNENHIRILEEQIRHLRSQLYGRKSEHRLISNQKQLRIFNEAEETVEKAVKNERIITVPAHERRKRGRKPLPPELPRIEVIHDLAPEDKLCCGQEMVRIGADTCEKLKITPAKIEVERHIRYKYACKKCEGLETQGGTVKIALMPPQLIPQGIATPSLMAYIITNKYVDALPLYRQEKIFERLGIDVGRGTMAHDIIYIIEKHKILLKLLKNEIRSGPLIQIDETTVQVMKEPGRSNTTKSYMWVFRGGTRDHPIILFQYHPTRSGEVAKEFLKNYQGTVQTDAYAGYDFIDEMIDIIHVGCSAHLRRNFADVIKSKEKAAFRSQLADEALAFIGRLYAIERFAKDHDYEPEQIRQIRQEQAKPIWEEFKAWLNRHESQMAPKSLLGKAFGYALNQWNRVIRYLDDGRIPIDNNWVENALRPFVLGRKNWLFAGHPRGAEASAGFYSLAETAKANGLEPYQYFNYLFERLPYAETEEDYRKLLPMYVELEPIKKSVIPAE